jgi:hypothetical protein
VPRSSSTDSSRFQLASRRYPLRLRRNLPCAVKDVSAASTTRTEQRNAERSQFAKREPIQEEQRSSATSLFVVRVAVAIAGGVVWSELSVNERRSLLRVRGLSPTIFRWTTVRIATSLEKGSSSACRRTADARDLGGNRSPSDTIFLGGSIGAIVPAYPAASEGSPRSVHVALTVVGARCHRPLTRLRMGPHEGAASTGMYDDLAPTLVFG